MILVGGLGLLPCQRGAGLASGSLQFNDVTGARLGDRRAEHRLLCFPQTDLAREVVGDALLWREPHELYIGLMR